MKLVKLRKALLATLTPLPALLTIATLTSVGLWSSASAADYVYTDDGLHVNQYLSTGGSPNTFAAAAGSVVRGMAFTTTDSLGVDTVLAVAGGNSAIYAYSSAGVQTVFASSTSSNDVGANLSLAIGIAVDAASDVFVGANNGTEIQEFNSSGAFVQNIVSSGLKVDSLAINAVGQLFEADNNSGKINEFTISGSTVTESTFADLAGFNPSSQNYLGMAFDHQGNLLVSYQNTNNSGGIYEIGSGGGVDSVYSEAGFRPVSLSYDSNTSELYLGFYSGNSGGVDSFTDSGTLGSALTATNFISEGSIDIPYGLVAVPEPSTWLMLAGSLLSILLFRKSSTSSP